METISVNVKLNPAVVVKMDEMEKALKISRSKIIEMSIGAMADIKLSPEILEVIRQGQSYYNIDLRLKETSALASLASGVSPRNLSSTPPWCSWNQRERENIIDHLIASGLVIYQRVKTGKRGPKKLILITKK